MRIAFSRIGFLRLLVGTLAFMAFAPSAVAQDYPSRQITLIVPYPPGGGVDAMARIVGEKLTAALGQQVVVENRGGGGGNIGTRSVAKAAPDGYTLLLGHTGTISINPALYTNAGYDPEKDFSGIGLIAAMPVALIAHPSFPPRSIKELIEYARMQNGKLNIGTSALGTGGYMCAELFKSLSGIDAQIVPYKGTAPLMNDLVGGHVPVAFGVLPPAIGNLQAGTLRAIAVTSMTRFSELPDVPTVDESGMKGFDAVLRYGLLAPKGTPQPIIDKLSAELRKLADDPEVKKRIATEGGDPISSTAAEYDADIVREADKWGGLVRKLGLKVD
jgi:tripartite-type tricarboxylate transporter receptor subunit TctC